MEGWLGWLYSGECSHAAVYAAPCCSHTITVAGCLFCAAWSHSTWRGACRNSSGNHGLRVCCTTLQSIPRSLASSQKLCTLLATLLALLHCSTIFKYTQPTNLTQHLCLACVPCMPHCCCLGQPQRDALVPQLCGCCLCGQIHPSRMRAGRN